MCHLCSTATEEEASGELDNLTKSWVLQGAELHPLVLDKSWNKSNQLNIYLFVLLVWQQ